MLFKDCANIAVKNNASRENACPQSGKERWFPGKYMFKSRPVPVKERWFKSGRER